ncbi:MAG: peptide-methionine (S)-S-oxide reductase MsrA [Acidimicrobiaceae bacterium]|nr:peptide-methionine (S)-S-oxide reductase MsrA [Acidimicrobiaceae bacterium]MCY4294418.1 peptide-methionine (S)-S-oxide reductase MsrA [Acidimicrobiaceae bacterium]
MLLRRHKTRIPDAAETLPGRQEAMPVQDYGHVVLGTPLMPPFPPECERAMFGMGCFWGVERFFWQMPGVHTTAAGYSGGATPNPTYQEVCSGRTGHNEVVLVVHDPAKAPYEQLLKVFWEMHDPTQGMRQGNDVGTQYRSGIYVFSEAQRESAETSRDRYQEALTAQGFAEITTEIVDAGPFYYAEDYHQQYLARNPGGYCNHGFCQVAYTPTAASAEAPAG